MSLKSGEYYVMTGDGNFSIGRNFIEDKSLLPKRVVTLPPNAGPGHTQPKWEISEVGGGLYKIKTNGSYVGVLPDGRIFAFLLEDMMQGAEWKIKEVPQHGENAFIILEPDDQRGWSFEENPFQQVFVNHVIVAPTEPPQFMPNMIFKITPA